MTTQLFPEQNTPIFIKQGHVGDCYLLAALDCIFNSGPAGYDHVKSLFTEAPDGVYVRLRHNGLSVHLNPAKLVGKYVYSYDKEKNEDVFFLSKARLDEIDSSIGGADSNSLAVKILEHVSSQYFIPNVQQPIPSFYPAPPAPAPAPAPAPPVPLRPFLLPAPATAPLGHRRTASLIAHDLPNRFKGSDSIFVAKLLGLYANDGFDFNEIIKIKSICPDQPIYITMRYGRTNGAGQFHQRHALRIDKIIPGKKNPNEYSFVLVNPWNNKLSETYNLETLKERKCRFSVFVTDHQKHRLLLQLMKAPETLGQAVYTHPELLQMVLNVQRVLGSKFSLQDVEYCVMLHNQDHLIPAMFNQLSEVEQRKLVKDMSSAKSNLQDPWHQFVTQFFAGRRELMRRSALYSYNLSWANWYTELSVQKINAVSVSFDAARTVQETNKYAQHLIGHMWSSIEYDPGLIAAEHLLGLFGVARRHPVILMAFEAKVRAIQALAEKHRSEIGNASAAREHFGLFASKADAIKIQPTGLPMIENYNSVIAESNQAPIVSVN